MSLWVVGYDLCESGSYVWSSDNSYSLKSAFSRETLQRGRAAVPFASVQGLQDLTGPADFKAQRCHSVETILLNGPWFGVGGAVVEFATFTECWYSCLGCFAWLLWCRSSAEGLTFDAALKTTSLFSSVSLVMLCLDFAIYTFYPLRQFERWPFVCLLGRSVCSVLCPLLNRFVWFLLLLSYMNSLYILNISHLL